MIHLDWTENIIKKHIKSMMNQMQATIDHFNSKVQGSDRYNNLVGPMPSLKGPVGNASFELKFIFDFLVLNF